MNETGVTGSDSGYQNCFACGRANPRGLRLVPRDENGGAVAEFRPDATIEGYPGVTHGGLVATVLDEVMVWAARTAAGTASVTGELTVRYVKPVRTGGHYFARGRVRENKGRLVLTDGTLTDESGEVFARAQAKLFVVTIDSEAGEGNSLVRAQGCDPLPPVAFIPIFRSCRVRMKIARWTGSSFQYASAGGARFRVKKPINNGISI
jgi:uncharacterized protein (TIGR00369 family)